MSFNYLLNGDKLTILNRIGCTELGLMITLNNIKKNGITKNSIIDLHGKNEKSKK